MGNAYDCYNNLAPKALPVQSPHDPKMLKCMRLEMVLPQHEETQTMKMI